MTRDEVEQMKVLCQQIETEKDQQKFEKLIHELNELLERKHQRFKHSLPPTESK